MVFGRGNLPFHQHVRVFGYDGALRVFRGEQRLPALKRQIPRFDTAAAIARIPMGEVVDFFVAGIVVMPLDPHEFHRSGPLRDLTVDGGDELTVLHRLALRVLPTVLFPAAYPGRGTVDGILRVGFDHERLSARVSAQGFKHRAQLTDLVGAVRGAAGVAIALVLVPGSPARVRRMVGPCPPHRTVRIA